MSVKGKHLIHLVPHGINTELFKPLADDHIGLTEFRHKLFGKAEYDFIFFYNSRNIQRKRTSNIMLAYRTFCDNLPLDKAKRCLLILHTERVLDAGTDLTAVHDSLVGEYNVLILENHYSPEDMNLLYNIVDVTINVSSSEGFGLSVAESIMTGTPVIVNVTGGMQDQIGQLDDDGNPVKLSRDFGSNNVGRYRTHGRWAKPIWPVTRVVQGSPPTPYIFDDLCKWEDVAQAMMDWYQTPEIVRRECGMEGRRWAMNEGGINHVNMREQFIKAMDFTLANFIPEKPFSLHMDSEFTGNTMKFNSPGFEIPKLKLT